MKGDHAMNTGQSLKRFTVVAAFLLAALPAFSQAASKVELKPQELNERAKQLQLAPTTLKNIRAASARVSRFTGWAVVQEFQGNFDSVAKSFDQFSNEFKTQKLQAAPNQPSVLIILDDPSSGNFHYLVGYDVQKKLDVKEPLTVRQMEHPKAVRFTHTGPYEKLGNVHAGVAESVKELHNTETKFPVVLRLLNDPRKVSPAERKTEMIVPVS